MFYTINFKDKNFTEGTRSAIFAILTEYASVSIPKDDTNEHPNIQRLAGLVMMLKTGQQHTLLFEMNITGRIFLKGDLGLCVKVVNVFKPVT